MHAFWAASGSQKVTLKKKKKTETMSFKAKNLRVNNNTRRNTYKAVAFGSAAGLISDHDSFNNVPKLFEVAPERDFVGFPC